MKSKYTPLIILAMFLSIGSFLLTTLAICYGNYSLAEKLGWNSFSFATHAAVLWLTIGILSEKIPT